METTSKNYYVGRYTAGTVCILGGILYILSLFTTIISLQTACKLWPLIFIGVGAELIIASVKAKGEKIRYDWLSIVLIFVMISAAFMMQIFNMIVTYVD